MTAPETRWTADTELLAAKVFLRVAYTDCGDDPATVDADWNAADEESRVDTINAIRPVLAALSDAGLLLPPGGETNEEWGTRHLDIETSQWVEAPAMDRMDALGVLEHLDEVWGHHAQLIRRTNHVGPWIEVPS